MAETVEPVTFDSGGNRLVGLLHHAGQPTGKVLIILVGGPQYRVGAHRQYVHLARYAAARGVDTLRFDYSGLGDSAGTFPGFENTGGEIARAVAFVKEHLPHAEEIYLWGLCESASSAMMFASDLPDVTGIVATNPWVENPQTKSRTLLRHYYVQRLTDRQFWRDLFRGKIAVGASLHAFLKTVKLALRGGRTHAGGDGPGAGPSAAPREDFRVRMARGLMAYAGETLILLSENDLTAREFQDFTKSNKAWKKAYRKSGKRLSQQYFKGCDHTFSNRDRRDRLAGETVGWILQDRPTPAAPLR